MAEMQNWDLVSFYLAETESQLVEIVTARKDNARTEIDLRAIQMGTPIPLLLGRRRAFFCPPATGGSFLDEHRSGS